VADGAEPRVIAADDLEAAVLDRTRPRRAFKRLLDKPLETLLTAKK
jgi:proteasome alpha subunit